MKEKLTTKELLAIAKSIAESLNGLSTSNAIFILKNCISLVEQESIVNITKSLSSQSEE